MGLSGYRGVSMDKRNPTSPFVARFRGRHLGSFEFLEDARIAYRAAVDGVDGGLVRAVELRLDGKTSRQKGVRLRSDGYWQAYLGRRHLGLFKTEVEAIRRRVAEELRQGIKDWDLKGRDRGIANRDE